MATTTVFTNGDLSRGEGPNEGRIVRVRFGDEWTNAYRRHELTSDERLETDGVVIERVSLDGPVLEVVGRAELAARGIAADELNRGLKRFCVMYTRGAVARSDADAGKTLLQVAFDDTASADRYERYELTADDLVRTDGAIAESFGPDGRLIEVIPLAELAQRGVDPHFLSTEELATGATGVTGVTAAATGRCLLESGGCGGLRCDQDTCTGACTLETSGSLKWCKCS
ncbi:hypothetical protein [Micromonospora sp. NPDC004551]|uniref:hypothetical protein n=1 Tax=Micromonospora sp. NPDC004551 TaxID=3154284 RepID=UPI0033A31EA2